MESQLCHLHYGEISINSNAASEHGPEIDRLMIISMVVIFIVQTITQFYYTISPLNTKEKKDVKHYFMQTMTN